MLKGYDGPTLECDKCGREMQLKNGRFGKYFGCTGINDTGQNCKKYKKAIKKWRTGTSKVDPIAMPDLRCEKVDDFYVLRDGASGLFLAASQFPRHRETRAPLVRELLPYSEKIDDKYHFLLKAPLKDSDGNDAIIRFNRENERAVCPERERWQTNGLECVL